MRFSLVLSAGFAALICAAPLARAQGIPAQAGAGATLEEVVVTAEKRSENIEKAPLAISALSADDLADAGVKSGTDLSNLVPGLTISSFGPTANISLRGIQNEVFNAFGESDVAYNVDGVFEGRPTSANGTFYDVARVEVLKGPQGTLYGRNATAGAINIVTNDPTQKYEAAATVSAGDYGLFHTEGMINVPVDDTLAFRAAFSSAQHDGYLSNDTDDEDSIAGRLKVLWTPSDDLRIKFQGDYDHEGGNGNATVPTDANGGFLFNNHYYVPQSLPDSLAPGNPLVQINGPQSQDNRIWGVQLQADWDLGWSTLTVLPAYRETREFYTNYLGGFYQQQNNDDHQTTVEARLTSDDAPGDRFKWVGGLYYFREEQPHYDTVEVEYPGLLFPNSPALISTQIAPSLPASSYAAFGQSTYSILDWLRLTAGVRGTHDLKKANGEQFIQFAEPGSINTGTGPALPGTTLPFVYRQSVWKTNWKVGLDADVTPDSLVYANVSTGYKAGGFFAVAPTPIPGIFQPEKLLAYSLGTKNQFLNNRLQVNGEGFYWDYQQFQYANIFLDGSSVAYGVFNLPKAIIDGFDLDTTYLLTDNDRVTGSLEYLHTNTGKAVVPGIGVPLDVSNEALPNAPRWSAHLAYEHIFELPNEANITAQVLEALQTRQRITLGPLAGFFQNGYSNTSLNLTYTAPNGNWTVGAWVKNLEDASVKNFGGTGFTQYVFDNLYPPRTYGVTLTAKIGWDGPAKAEPVAAAPPPPAPAPAPVAAPEPQRRFQVFFDFDKSTITSAAAAVIAEAAKTVEQGHIAHIEIVGHTDTVGSAGYNLKLSERRADAIKQQLITDGLPQDEITTSGVGKSGLLVPTKDGVREPQNRRAEINLGNNQT